MSTCLFTFRTPPGYSLSAATFGRPVQLAVGARRPWLDMAGTRRD